MDGIDTIPSLSNKPRRMAAKQDGYNPNASPNRNQPTA